MELLQVQFTEKPMRRGGMSATAWSKRRLSQNHGKKQKERGAILAVARSLSSMQGEANFFRRIATDLFILVKGV